jgi:hypothetical protein
MTDVLARQQHDREARLRVLHKPQRLALAPGANYQCPNHRTRGTTPVRALIDEAVSLVPGDKLAFCVVVESGSRALHSVAFGDPGQRGLLLMSPRRRTPAT